MVEIKSCFGDWLYRRFNADGAITPSLFDVNGKRRVDANGKIIRNPDRDLQMTTLAPHDFDQPSLPLSFKDFREPKIQIWDNVTFADNYGNSSSANTWFDREGNGQGWYY